MNETTETKSIATDAECVSAEMDDDGQRWEATDGRELAEVCEAYGGRAVGSQRGVRWTFPDGSAIVESESAWDLGFSGLDDCYCWAGCAADYPENGGHNEVCPHATDEE